VGEPDRQRAFSQTSRDRHQLALHRVACPSANPDAILATLLRVMFRGLLSRLHGVPKILLNDP
jgi:hypothetical protein